MPILIEETFLEGGQLFKKNFQSRNLHSRARARLNVRISGFVYIKSHVTLHVNSKAQKVNWDMTAQKFQ